MNKVCILLVFITAIVKASYLSPFAEDLAGLFDMSDTVKVTILQVQHQNLFVDSKSQDKSNKNPLMYKNNLYFDFNDANCHLISGKEKSGPFATENEPNEFVKLQFQGKCPKSKNKMMEDIFKFLERDVNVPNDDCKCVNVERGLPVKKYHKWYIFQPTFNLPTFIVELKGPKSNITKANIEENQMTLKNKKYFIVKSDCDICFKGEQDGVEIHLLPCNELHMYCSKCIPKLPKKICPVCRAPITVDIRLQEKINEAKGETYGLPQVLFEKYNQSWVYMSLRFEIKFNNFQDANWKQIVKTYVRFVSPYVAAVAVKFLNGDWIFSWSPPSIQGEFHITLPQETNAYRWLIVAICLSAAGVPWNVGELPVMIFAEITFIIVFPLDWWWIIFCFLAFNINRLVKNVTNNNIGIDFTHLGPTMFVLGYPYYGVFAQEFYFLLIHGHLVGSLLQSLKNYNKILLVVATVLSSLIWALWIHNWGFPNLLEIKNKSYGENEGNSETHVLTGFVRTYWNILGQITLFPLLFGHIFVTFPIIIAGIFEVVKPVLVACVQYVRASLESLFIPKCDFVI